MVTKSTRSVKKVITDYWGPVWYRSAEVIYSDLITLSQLMIIPYWKSNFLYLPTLFMAKNPYFFSLAAAAHLWIALRMYALKFL